MASTVTTSYERRLGELETLVHELDWSTREVLDRVREARERVAISKAEAEPPLIAFVHIPKTAGGTATRMFVEAYSPASLHDAGHFLRGPEHTVQKLTRRSGGWSVWRKRGGRVTVGHVPYAVFAQHVPDDTLYMTFLREPVDRVLSHYYRHIHRPELSPEKVIERREERGRVTATSLEEAMVEQNAPQLNNLATRFLCAHPSPTGDLAPSALDEAKENLRRFAFVGIQERFEESIVLLQRALGLGSTPYLNRHESAPGARPSVEEIPPEQRALIEERNSLDAELYAFGLELFEAAVAAADHEFDADVARLRASNTDLSDQATRKAREWLDSGLPIGTTRRREEVYEAAKAAGVSLLVLRPMLRRLPSVVSTVDADGEKIFRRHETAPLGSPDGAG